MPTDAEIESSLRNAVRAHYENPKEEDATVNFFRSVSREELGLDEDFYKSAEWKSRSKDIIQDQFEKSQAEQNAKPKATEPKEKQTSLKRASPATSPRPRKKSKITQVQQEDEAESTALSEPPESDEESSDGEKITNMKKNKKVVGKPKTGTRPRNRKASSELSDAPSPQDEDSTNGIPTATKVDGDDDTSSELSSVIDDPEPPKKKSKAKNGDTKPSKSSKSSSKSKPTESDPNAEEIKRLQGWLAKCGIRKVWGKELKPFETPKAKINHLKKLLADVGMTGRYSNDKAAQIKEARELAADIEAVQEGNERWGKTSDDDGEDDSEKSRPKRRLIRGAQNYDFLSSDGEETD